MHSQTIAGRNIVNKTFRHVPLFNPRRKSTGVRIVGAVSEEAGTAKRGTTKAVERVLDPNGNLEFLFIVLSQ